MSSSAVPAQVLLWPSSKNSGIALQAASCHPQGALKTWPGPAPCRSTACGCCPRRRPASYAAAPALPVGPHHSHHTGGSPGSLRTWGCGDRLYDLSSFCTCLPEARPLHCMRRHWHQPGACLLLLLPSYRQCVVIDSKAQALTGWISQRT